MDVMAKFGVLFEVRKSRISSGSIVSEPPTQPSLQWVPGVLSPGLKRGRGVTLTTHPHLVPRSSMSRRYIPSTPKRLRGL
jgi:hypothetical protein